MSVKRDKTAKRYLDSDKIQIIIDGLSVTINWDLTNNMK